MTPEQLAARNAATSEGQKRAWQDPDIRARRSAAIRAAKEDPLQCALRRKLSAEIAATQKRIKGKFVRDEAALPKPKRIYEKGTAMDRLELTRRIRELVGERGMTRRNAAIELGVSRNTVCGICSRSGIGLRPRAPSASVERAAAVKAPPRPHAAPAPVERAAAVKAPPKPEPPPASRAASLPPVPVPRSVIAGPMQCVSLLDLEEHHCRWPVADAHSEGEMRYCGRQREGSGPYCAEHASIARDEERSSRKSGPPALLLRPAQPGRGIPASHKGRVASGNHS